MEILEFKEDFMFNCFHKGLRTNPYTLSPYDNIRTWQNLTVGGLSLGGKVSNTKKKKTLLWLNFLVLKRKDEIPVVAMDTQVYCSSSINKLK